MRLGLLALLFASEPLMAQSSGSIVGQVTDLTGAVVPGAKIVVKSVEPGIQRRRSSTTTSDCYYSAPSLPLANYTVSGANPSSCPVGTREYYIARKNKNNFGVFNMGNNNPGRQISLGLKVSF